MKKIYFVRHSLPNFEIKDDRTRPLSAEGIERCKEIDSFFKEIEIDAIYSSPFKRAYDTVINLSKIKKIEIKYIEDFRERKVSDKWIEDFNDFAKKQWNDFNYKLKDGESLSEVQNRNIKGLEAILQNKEYNNIVIATHGTALSTIVNYYDNLFGINDFNRIKNKMPFIMIMTFNGLKYISKKEVFFDEE